MSELFIANKNYSSWSLRPWVLLSELGIPFTETLLMYASRRDHIERTLQPALQRGAVVLCDRYADSTRAYQGAAGGTDPGLISALEHFILEDVRPALTLVFDLDPELGLARALGRPDAEARFESKGLDFHRRLRAGFLAIAAAEPDRCRIVDASGDPDAVEARVLGAAGPVLGLGRDLGDREA